MPREQTEEKSSEPYASHEINVLILVTQSICTTGNVSDVIASLLHIISPGG